MNFPKIIVTLVIGYLSFVAYSSSANAAEDLEEITIQIMEANDDVHEFINRIELPPAVAPQRAPAATAREEKRVRREHERAGDDMDDGEHDHLEKVETGHHADKGKDKELRNELREHEEQSREEVRSAARQEIEDRKGDSREEARAEAEAQQEETRSEARQQIEEDRATTKDEVRDQQDDAQNSADAIRDDAAETVDDNTPDDNEIDDDIEPSQQAIPN